MLRQFGDIEVIFDTVNKKGMAMMQKKYMKQVGHADAQMFFCVDSVAELAGKIGGEFTDVRKSLTIAIFPKTA